MYVHLYVGGADMDSDVDDLIYGSGDPGPSDR